MKRLLALLLCLALLVSMTPNIFAQNGAEAEDLWDQIQRLEDSVYKPGRTINVAQAERAYAGAIEEIIQLVEASDDFVPGSIVRNGDFFFWDQKDGTACGYSPRLRARIRETARPEADPEAYAGIETVCYNTKGGWPNSASVAAFQPYVGIDSSFTNQYELRCNSIAQALDGVGTTYKTNDATIDNIANALQTCAVVIFDSHGDTDYASGYDYTSRANTSYICLQNGAGFTAEDQATVTGPYGSYKHAYYGGGYGNMNYYMADGTAIANHMTGNSPNGLLWMAICLGMATDGLQKPLREKGVEVVYGYSQSVTFSGDYAWEGKFWPKMIEGDCVKDAIAYMKQQVGIKDPYTNSYPAWPIVASSEDPYPGHGNVDKAQTVYSTWTLFTQFAVNAVSNNTDWGTVKLQGNKITANPKNGYYADSYELLEGEAVVTREGNVFNVEPQSDCTIQINFAPRDPAVVNFSVPEGVSCDPLEAYVGDMITMPTPTGAPTAQGYEYRFLGWVTAPMNADALELPEFIKAGTKIKVTEASSTYYALYSYFVAQDGLDDDQFLRVDEAPASWAGEYVITYNGAYALGASRDCVGTKLGSTKAVVDLAAKGCVVEGNLLNNVTEDITWVVDPGPDGSYTIKMKAANYYLAMSADSDSLNSYTSSNTDMTRWTITMGENGPVITNKKYNSRFLQYNSGSGIFRCYTSPQQPLTLFAKADGDTWYTTDPKDKVVCQEHQFGDWTVENEPTCTGSGLRVRYCTVCGYKETQTIEALGHNWGAPVYTWTEAGEGWSCTASVTCVNDASHVESETVQANYEVTTEPGYTTPGVGIWTANFTDVRFSKQVKEVEIPVIEPIVISFMPGTAGDNSVPGETILFSTDNPENWSVSGQAELGKFFEINGQLWFSFPECMYEKPEGYQFLGWLKEGDTKPYSDGEPINPSTASYVAQWAPEYKINAVSMGEIAEWQGMPETAGAGQTITIMIKVFKEKYEEGYRLEKVVISNSEGTVLEELTKTQSGKPFLEAKPLPFGAFYLFTSSFKMPATDVTVTAVFQAPEHVCPCAEFSDMPEYGTVEHTAIDWAFTHDPQITNGTGDGMFHPERRLMRSEAVTFLWRAAGKPEPTTTRSPFSDVPNGEWYTKAVLWAVEKGITKGTGDGKFSPNMTLDTGMMLTFLYRQQNMPQVQNTHSYSDVPSWYVEGVSWAVENKIAAPKSAAVFGSAVPSLRADTVVYLYRVYTGNMLAE